jgi:pteridine reductase
MALDKAAALVTGGGKRIGAAFALHLAQRGYDIALHYNKSSSDAEATADKIRSLGVSCRLLRFDLTKPCESLIDKAVEVFPNLEILINNASVFTKGKTSETSAHDAEQTLKVNYLAPYSLSTRFRALIDRGLIVNILDERICRHDMEYSAYTISKKALADFTLSSAVEFAPNIRVNAIAPGYILAPVSEAPNIKKVKSQIPLGKIGGIKDLNMALDYLLDAEYVSGQILFVDGGRHLRQTHATPLK